MALLSPKTLSEVIEYYLNVIAHSCGYYLYFLRTSIRWGNIHVGLNKILFLNVHILVILDTAMG